MKVIQLLDNFNYGGGERVSLTYHDTLTELGIQSLIVAIKNKREGQKDVFLFSSYISYFSYILYSIFKESNNFILIAHTNRALLLSCFLRILFIRKVKLVYVQHLNYNKYIYKVISIFQFLIDKYIQITPVTSDVIKRYIRKDKLFYINNYVDVDNYPISVEGERLLDRILCDIKSRQIITFVGAFRKGKNVSHIQELVKRLDENAYFFLIIGNGEEFNLLDKDLIAKENVRFLGYQSNPLPFMSLSDYIFFPSYENGNNFGEMMPMTILEAFEMNCRVIAYNLPVNKFLLPESNVFNYQDFEAIAKAIKFDNVKIVKSPYNKFYGIEKFKGLIQALQL